MREQEIGGDVREIAITLVREPAQSRDIIRPKRAGVGITFETVHLIFHALPGCYCCYGNSHSALQSRQDAVDNSAKVKNLIRGSPADRSGLIKTGDVSDPLPSCV